MCTCLKIKAKDSSVVVARTMEFGVELDSKMTIFPRGYKYKGSAPSEKIGLEWEGEYGFVGMDAMGLPYVSDGLNEAGLYVGDLLLPGFAQYQDVPEGEEVNSLAPLDVAGYLLSTCQNVAEAKEAIKKVFVWAMNVPQLSGVLPLHFAVHDTWGNSAVFEYVKGELNIVDNPLGVLTNSPYFDWHMINVRNFVNLSANNIPDLKLKGDDVVPIGQGSGMLGLPGDSTPPSRFVRAVALTQSVLEAQNAEEATKNAFHVINNFDIPKGFVREERKGQMTYDYTSWLTISNLKEKIYYYRGYDNMKFYRVKLADIDFSASDIRRLDTTNSDWFEEIS